MRVGAGLEHKEIVVADIENRRITLKCICGWQAPLRLEPGTYSRYADQSLWASHFDLKPSEKI